MSNEHLNEDDLEPDEPFSPPDPSPAWEAFAGTELERLSLAFRAWVVLFMRLIDSQSVSVTAPYGATDPQALELLARAELEDAVARAVDKSGTGIPTSLRADLSLEVVREYDLVLKALPFVKETMSAVQLEFAAVASSRNAGIETAQGIPISIPSAAVAADAIPFGSAI